jgi:hypothetical protein
MMGRPRDHRGFDIKGGVADLAVPRSTSRPPRAGNGPRDLDPQGAATVWRRAAFERVGTRAAGPRGLRRSDRAQLYGAGRLFVPDFDVHMNERKYRTARIADESLCKMRSTC